MGYDWIGHLNVESFLKIWVWDTKVEDLLSLTLADLSDFVTFRAIMVKIGNLGLFDVSSTMRHIIWLQKGFENPCLLSGGQKWTIFGLC